MDTEQSEQFLPQFQEPDYFETAKINVSNMLELKSSLDEIFRGVEEVFKLDFPIDKHEFPEKQKLALLLSLNMAEVMSSELARLTTISKNSILAYITDSGIAGLVK